MRKKPFSTLLVILILLMVAGGLPAAGMASEAPGTVVLSSSSAPVGATVTASGVFAPDTWVAVKVVDGSGNIVFYDEVLSGSGGAYSCSFKVPSVPAGTLDVIAGYDSNVASVDLTVIQTGATTHTVGVLASPVAGGTVAGGGSYAAGDSVTVTAAADSGYRFVNWTEGGTQVSTSASYTFTMGASDIDLTANFTANSSGDWGNSGGSTATPVNNTGSATLTPATGGTVSLGSEAALTIPKGALAGDTSVAVTVTEDTSPPAVPSGFLLLGSVYQFTVGGANHYTFGSAVTLTLSFDPAKLPPSSQPAIFYYDDAKGQWVSLGGTVNWNNDTITVTVDHFTRYAVLATKAIQATSSTATVFSDVPSSYWAYDAITSLNGKGCISGYPDGSFAPDALITRAEFVSIMDKVLNLPADDPAKPDFSDISGGDWYYNSVETAVYAGIARGYGNGMFRPGYPITREEMACVLVRALGIPSQVEANTNTEISFTDDAGISGWARGSVVVAVQNLGLLKGYPDGSFRPQGDATRAEACAMIMNFLKANVPGK